MSARNLNTRMAAFILAALSISTGLAGCGDSNTRVDQTPQSSTAQPATGTTGPGGAAQPMMSSDTQRTLLLLEDQEKPAASPKRPAMPTYDRRGGAGIEDQPRGSVGRR